MEKEQFEKLVETLLGDMKLFKQLVRKSLNLLQGMELMQSGYVFGVNSTTGGPVNKANGDGATATATAGNSSSNDDQSGLDKVMESRLCFPALRRASYRATVELLRAYRQSVSRLMEVAPLEEHIDLKDHYLVSAWLSVFPICHVTMCLAGLCGSVRVRYI